jgi:hypothetical protein
LLLVTALSLMSTVVDDPTRRGSVSVVVVDQLVS